MLSDVSEPPDNVARSETNVWAFQAGMRAIVFALAGVVATAQAVSGNTKRAACSDLHLVGAYTSSYGAVTLVQHDCRVTGTYYDDASGRIAGRVDGNMIRYRWIEGSGGGGGLGVWVAASDGELFGRWGSVSSDRDGGAWDLEPVRAIAH
jgi:hypothetical protein